MKKLSLILGLILLFGLVLSACESSGSGSGGNSFNVTMTDFKFEPSSITVSAGKQFTVNLKNNGSVQHTWTVMKTPITGSYTSANQSDVLFGTDPVPAGGSKTASFTAPTTPGTYQIICTVQGHLEAGMQGQLIVK